MKSAFRMAITPFNFALWLILSVVLTVAGPFGTYESTSAGLLLVYWSLVVVVSATLGYHCTYVARYLMRRRPPLFADLLSTVFMALTFAPLNVYLVRWLILQDDSSGPSVGQMMGYVSAITFAILTGRRFIPGLEEDNYLPRSHDANRPRLMRRLPESSQGRVLRLSSQGHFVDVVTDAGVTRLRMRLADAIDEMDGVNGYCTHRSHWVAEGAIASIEKQNGKQHVRLDNGETVPISRTYRPELEKAGLF